MFWIPIPPKMTKSGRFTTQLFVDPTAVFDDMLELSSEEAHHAARVLRLRPGDEFVAVDGAGGWYKAVLEQVESSRARGRIVERRTDVGEPKFALALAIGMIKQPARLELLVEKAVELGVTELAFMQTDRSERSDVPRGRLDRIARAALKQSGRSRLPQLRAPIRYEELLSCPDSGTEARRLLCHERADFSRSLHVALQESRAALDLVVFIGPEGGFSPGEVDAAEAAGAAVVSLGPRRLRTETAALAAAAQIMGLRANGPEAVG